MDVRVTVSVGARKVPLEEVSDLRVKRALGEAARAMGAKLELVRCPEHEKAATNVRMHFDKSGAASLTYDSCCEVLGKQIGQALA